MVVDNPRPKTMPTAKVALTGAVLLLALASSRYGAANGCEVDYACREAVRALPLHPATLGEAVDARHAIDVACESYHACLKSAEADEAQQSQEKEQQFLENCKEQREAWNRKHPDRPVSTDCSNMREPPP
jgi:hypothetical protein